MVSPEDIPQANDLRKIRAVTAALASGLSKTDQVAQKTAIAPRQVDYAKRAASVLGWLQESPAGLSLTESGAFLLAQPPRSLGELDAMRRSIERSSVLQRIAPDLLAAKAPSQEQLAARIRSASSLSEETARRRAQALLSWRRQIMDGGNLRLPETDAPVRVETFPKSRSRLKRVVPPAPAFLLPEAKLSTDLVRDILRDNPWWESKPGKALPPHRREFVQSIHRRLEHRLAPIIVVRGPRQVGKTTAQLQVISDLLDKGVSPHRILRVQCDELPSIKGLNEPILRIVDWFESAVLKNSLNAAAQSGEGTFLFFDEVQNLPDWAIQLKHLVDASTTQVVVTGSSALRIEAGRDSLAGRINSIEVGTLTLREIAAIRNFGVLQPSLADNGLESLGQKDFWHNVRENGSRQSELRDASFLAFSGRGGYPLVHEHADTPWSEVAEQLNETVIRRVIRHDLRVGDRGRKRDEALLEEIFRLACRYAGQSPSLDVFARETQRALRANVGTGKVRNYLDFLDRTLLLRLVKPLEIRLKRTQGAPKLCLADHGLRASWLQEVVPLAPDELARQVHLSELAGRIAESVVGSYLLTIGGLALSHFPIRPNEPEVDFVVTIGAQRIPIEIKYRARVDYHADTEGLRSFIEKSVYNAPFGILVTQDAVEVPDPRIVSIPLPSLLMMR